MYSLIAGSWILSANGFDPVRNVILVVEYKENPALHIDSGEKRVLKTFAQNYDTPSSTPQQNSTSSGFLKVNYNRI